MLEPIDQGNAYQVQPYQPQVVIHKDRANVDTAALLAAATKNGQELGEFRRVVSERQPQFVITVEHIFAAAGAAGVMAFIVAAVALDASISQLYHFYREDLSSWMAAIYWSIGTAAAVFVGLLVMAVRQLNNTYHEDTQIIYQADERSGAAAVAIRQTFRLEVQEGNRLSFIDLPDWFTDDKLFALAAHYQNGGGFSREELAAGGICTQPDFPLLRDKFDSAGLAVKNGKSWELTESFFALVERAKVE